MHRKIPPAPRLEAPRPVGLALGRATLDTTALDPYKRTILLFGEYSVRRADGTR